MRTQHDRLRAGWPEGDLVSGGVKLEAFSPNAAYDSYRCSAVRLKAADTELLIRHNGHCEGLQEMF